MRRQVRREELTRPAEGAARAASDLLGVYAGLAERKAHLLGDLLAGVSPLQWERYPADDAVDSAGRYQWFYHSHAPEDRPAGTEHGHIHLFARRALWKKLPVKPDDRRFRKLCGNPNSDEDTRHLLAIGLDAKGLPVSLFAVNSWVTGDLMLGADATARLLADIELDTGHTEIDRMIISLARLCGEDIRGLLRQSDRALGTHAARGALANRAIEILAQVPLNLDAMIANALNQAKSS